MKKKVLIILAVVVLLLSVASLGSDDTQKENTETYNLYLDIEFEQNILLATYDVEVCIDDTKVGVIPHGDHFTYLCEGIPKGKHKVYFYKETDHNVSQSITVDLESDTTCETTIHSNRSSIETKDTDITNGIIGNALAMISVEGKTLSEAIDELKQIGFINIHYSGGTWDKDSNIIIKQNIKEGSIEDKNVLIELECQEAESSDSEAPKSVDLSKLEIPEEVKRSAVVFWTNNTAMDVFTSDGNNYDTQKLHKYSDLSGKTIDYLIYVDNWGTWTTLEENSKWFGEGVELRKHDEYNNILRYCLNFEIEKENDTYYIRKCEHYLESDREKFGPFTIFEELSAVPDDYVSEDRDTNKVDELDKTDDITEAQALTIFRKYGESMYPYGFKYHALSSYNSTKQYADGSWFVQYSVTVENQYGNKYDGVASAYINNATQTIDNFKLE